eukprot:CAMPEP_0198265540 /NCGR_PEP_ID=MMETSP1447-20131203/23105_1 /TAXON_ID=420782 /ORGANISM="Chaetoceros dichaeta, Strain CCMP1751" /LENGTH=178 /DNA_ID=CAMNT_0043955081 /DNA_START=33 /DNA_END=569 /DNA_ORIENTATION=+
MSFPLHEAVKAGDIATVRTIIAEKSINANEETENGITALIEACIAGNAEIANLLLDQARCPAQPTPPFKHTPLRGASVSGRYEMIPLLLKAGADPNAKSDGNRTPLMGACFLRENVNDGDDHEEISALCVRALLDDSRTDVLMKNDFNETALDLAKSREYEESVRLLEAAIKDKTHGA